jgi:hypothetical protein
MKSVAASDAIDDDREIGNAVTVDIASLMAPPQI